MKRKLLLGGALAMSLGLFAQQQPPNQGFEDWDAAGTAQQEPQQWNSMMTGDFSCGLCGNGQTQTIWEETSIVHSGNKSVKLETQQVTVFFVTARVNGTCSLGQIGTTAASAAGGYTRTIQGDDTFSEEFTAQPDSLVFWANYTPNVNNPDHFASAAAVLHASDPSGSFWNPTSHANYDPTYLNGDATALFTQTSGWERKAQAFDYSTGAQTGNNYLLLTFASTDVAGADGDRRDDLLYIDDVMMVYNVTSGYSFTTACTGASISVPFTAKTLAVGSRTFTAQLSDASGSFASPTTIGTLVVNDGDTCVNTIAATIPGGTPNGAGYKIRVIGDDVAFASVAGSAFSVSAAPTAGTITPTASTNCTTANGQVAVTGSNGTTYELFTGAGASQTSNGSGSFTGLTPGDYYVEISNAGGCITTTSTVTVNAPANPTAGTITPTASTNCGTPNGQVAVTGSNGANFELFDSGNNSQASNASGAFTGLAPGDYYVEITANGCLTTTSTVTVNAPTAPAAGTLTPTDVTNCTTPNGQVAVTGSGGTSFELFDSGNNSQGSNTTGTFTGLSAGDYYVVVTDGNGCTATTTTETVGNAGAAPAAPSAGTNASYCIGDTPTDLSATAGSGGTLTWYLAGNVETTGTSLTPSTATAGTFVYTVTETVTGCESAPTSITITINPDAVAGTATPTASTSCTTADGQVAVSGDNGTSYELFDAGNNSQGTNTTGTFTGLTPGDYYVVVSNGCTPAQTATVTVGAPADPTVGTVTPTDNSNCTTANGEVNVSGSNGTSFELFDSGNNSVTSNGSGAFTGLTGDDYYVVITGANGCTSTSGTVTVSDPTAPTAGTTAASDNTDCANPNGAVNVTGSNGTSYELFDSGNTSQATNTTGAFTGLSQGDYYVVISDANGCETTTNTVTVGNNTGYSVTVAPTTTQDIDISTNGTAITATESATATSREWKYTTTSGSGYMSFAPTETGATYTPNFAAVGTYYVVCESVISGCTVMSSEVQINVTDPNASIDENEMDLVNVYAFEKQMFVDLSNVTLNNPILKVFSTDGKIVLEKRLNNGTMNTYNVDVPQGVYIFNIVTNENTATGKVVLK